MKITIIKSEWKNSNLHETGEQNIEAPNKDDLFSLFFREFDNRFKYCNDLSFAIKDETTRKEYRTWISKVENYANNGGDMW